MSDYTPSVAEMREYVETGGEPRPWVELDEAEEAREKFRGEAFDRMIEAVRAEALREVRDAWIRAGRVPAHHHQMKNQLRRDWPVLAGALDRIEREAGLK